MHIVSAILRRRLLQHSPVAIEGIGTLRMVKTQAQLLPGRRLEPPQRYPQLVPTELSDPYLQEVVAEELGLDLATATEACHQWHHWSLSADEQNGEMMILEGIGTIRFSTYELFPDPYFLTLLNPIPAEPLIAATPFNPAYSLAAPGVPEAEYPGGGAYHRRTQVRAKGKNPHNYTVSFFAILIVLAALLYLAYFLWVHTSIFSDFQGLF